MAKNDKCFLVLYDAPDEARLPEEVHFAETTWDAFTTLEDAFAGAADCQFDLYEKHGDGVMSMNVRIQGFPSGRVVSFSRLQKVLEGAWHG